MDREIDKAICWPRKLLHGCNLGKEYLHQNLYLTTEADLERGFVKVQRKHAYELTGWKHEVISEMLRDAGSLQSASEQMIMLPWICSCAKITRKMHWKSIFALTLFWYSLQRASVYGVLPSMCSVAFVAG